MLKRGKELRGGDGYLFNQQRRLKNELNFSNNFLRFVHSQSYTPQPEIKKKQCEKVQKDLKYRGLYCTTIKLDRWKVICVLKTEEKQREKAKICQVHIFKCSEMVWIILALTRQTSKGLKISRIAYAKYI